VILISPSCMYVCKITRIATAILEFVMAYYFPVLVLLVRWCVSGTEKVNAIHCLSLGMSTIFKNQRTM
jgi:hypothetical protein